jgi:hypothetical protein
MDRSRKRVQMKKRAIVNAPGHGSAWIDVPDQFRRSLMLEQETQVVLMRLEQLLFRSQAAVDRSRHQVSATRALLTSLERKTVPNGTEPPPAERTHTASRAVCVPDRYGSEGS